ncbi:phosphotransferase family protein [Corynebacterium auriscanis]|uniref:phosphotransferase family protein n=1 Tax=Corynebacterium auriscanis TaxID=99807 RepID=UPI003CE7FC78
MQSVEATMDAARHLLAARFGGTPELSMPEDLGGDGPALVLRCRVTPNPFLHERTVVIKQLPPANAGTAPVVDGQPEPESTNAGGIDSVAMNNLSLIREVVAYQYTNTLPEACRPGPLLLAYDIEQRILILSDAGDGPNYTDILTLHEPEERLVAVRKLGRRLGKMHANTFGGHSSYETLMKRQCIKHGMDSGFIAESDVDIAKLIRQGLGLLRENQVMIPDEVVAFAEESADRQSRTDLLAFTPFDLTPDNIMLANQVVFLDYDWASFRDIAFDVACVIAGFPQDNSTPALEDREIRDFISAWRAEVWSVWPAAKDDEVVARGLMTALIGWAFMSLMMLHYGRLNLERSRGFYPAEAADLSRDLAQLSDAQLQDLATTVDAIKRVADIYTVVDFSAVRDWTVELLRILARLGAHPQSRVV